MHNFKPMHFKYIISELADNILFITLNRPKKHNALCIDLVRELNTAFNQALTNTEINAVIILGNENAFSAGGDLKEMQQLSVSEAQKRSAYVQETFSLLKEQKVPVVSIISGVCLGGGLELAMHTDIRICTETAKIGLPEVKYGMIPGAGGTVQLPNYLGEADASYYLLTGSDIPLTKALNTGLIQKVIPQKVYDDEITMQADYFRSANVEGLKAIKSMVKLKSSASLSERYAAESEHFANLLTQQGRQGIENKFIKDK